MVPAEVSEARHFADSTFVGSHVEQTIQPRREAQAQSILYNKLKN
jgi:hypothetical protein